ncbi:hypothetical protein TC41_2153 [Alicyclobacillus acidocaldarius subsp. acidocaldarius Tc-4-1]|uniref:Uncharacterized protein n=1 Tax=Alicyclobacillus acidocaldarius (strain Tc-4-1) TaxID=1048834 RepID=F8IF94_ALIAT|nr:hypothetical protein TC41_2153 [Alicyclobacillus acidocaldarius subsp. acidocaldarius Tc-4-1]
MKMGAASQMWWLSLDYHNQLCLTISKFSRGWDWFAENPAVLGLVTFQILKRYRRWFTR